jgi:uncharacterized protein (DUF433 family)
MAIELETAMTPREASFVADVGYERITKAFENGEVPNVAGRPRKRTLNLRGVFAVAVADRIKQYPAPVKKRIQGQIALAMQNAHALSDVQDIVFDDYVVVTTFKSKELARGVEERIRKIERIRELIVSDGDVQAGAPTFRGTRIMARHIAEMIRNGIDRQEIAEDFPEVTDEMIEMATLYDQLYPQQGRPAVKSHKA